MPEIYTYYVLRLINLVILNPKEWDFMNVKRYINGKPVSESEFKNIEVRNKNTTRIFSDVIRRTNPITDATENIK
jgi:hypothetical protein